MDRETLKRYVAEKSLTFYGPRSRIPTETWSPVLGERSADDGEIGTLTIAPREVTRGREEPLAAGRSVAGVRTYARETQFLAKRESCRSVWLEAVEALGGSGMTAVRKAVPAQYKWLYRRDKGWLEANRPPQLTFSERRADRVDWSLRDSTLAAEVKVAASRIRNGAERPAKITFAALSRAVCMGGLQKGWLPNLPLTRQALDEVLESREAFAVRRVAWVAGQYTAEGRVPTRTEFAKRAGLGRLLGPQSVAGPFGVAFQGLRGV